MKTCRLQCPHHRFSLSWWAWASVFPFGKIKAVCFHAFPGSPDCVITRKAGRTRRVLLGLRLIPRPASHSGPPSAAAASLGLGPSPARSCAQQSPGLVSHAAHHGVPRLCLLCVSLSLFPLLSASHWLFFLPGALTQGLGWPVSGMLGLHVRSGEAVPFLLW